MQAERYIAAADIGTSKIALCVAQVNGDDVQVIYYRETPSRGMRYGSVFAPKQTADALKEAIGAAEDELKIRILQLVVGLPRYNVVQEIGSASINRDNPEESCITREEISDLKRLAIDSYPIDDSTKEEIYGAVAQSFSADDEITGKAFRRSRRFPFRIGKGNRAEVYAVIQLLRIRHEHTERNMISFQQIPPARGCRCQNYFHFSNLPELTNITSFPEIKSSIV